MPPPSLGIACGAKVASTPVSKGLFAQAAEAQVALIAIASPKRTARFDKKVKLVIISPF
jgi:hypothetical protein